MKLSSEQIANLRVDYALRSFSEPDLHPDPLIQFASWFDEALNAEVNEPNAMTLATASSDGKPSARIVLLKGISDQGFTFFTNYESRKGIEMQQNPNVALVFCWLELQRQVRIEGTISKVSAEESDAYFSSRPLKSQLGAIASAQSTPLTSRKELEERFDALFIQYEKSQPVRPVNWGGYLVTPASIEFWQGRQSRLHDRFVYQKQFDGKSWNITRLSP